MAEEINKNEEITEVPETQEASDQTPAQEKASEPKTETSWLNRKSKSKDKKDDKKYLERIDELEANLAELNDKYLRLFSEFDNYRKRTLKERLDLIKSASQDLIIELLPVVDDFERALKALETTHDSVKAAEGVQLIYNKYKNILLRKGLEPMVTKGQEFDTDFHEAITNVPAPSDDLKGKVIDEIEKGYLLNGKVIRFAKVIIGQ
jgi:molecular chaperone GrpE